jgi:hypothetical protein
MNTKVVTNGTIEAIIATPHRHRVNGEAKSMRQGSWAPAPFVMLWTRDTCGINRMHYDNASYGMVAKNVTPSR